MQMENELQALQNQNTVLKEDLDTNQSALDFLNGELQKR